MTTSTVTWTPVSEGLPDAESNVLLGLSSGFTCEGFLDADIDGRQVWRDVCAIQIEEAVVAWAELPEFDSHADTPEQPAPVPLSDEQIDAMWREWVGVGDSTIGLIRMFTRAVERAHGVGIAASPDVPDSGCAPNHFCNRRFVHLPRGEQCDRCGHE